MLMEITNKGKTRIRLLRDLYINPGQTLEVGDDLGSYAVRKHTDIDGKLPKPKKKPKIDFKREDDVDDIE